MKKMILIKLLLEKRLNYDRKAQKNKTVKVKPQKSNGLWGFIIYLSLFAFWFVYVYKVIYELLEKSVIKSVLILKFV